MGTKLNPGEFDCYEKALPDEPMFVLLARDPDFSRLVRDWGRHRYREIQIGEQPRSDMALVKEAFDCAEKGDKWRRENYGKWRQGEDTP